MVGTSLLSITAPNSTLQNNAIFRFTSSESARSVLQIRMDRLEERQRLDVTNCPTDLDDDHIALGGEAFHRALDLVGHVRDHLNRRAQVFAAALLGDDVQVNSAGGDVVGLRERPVDEPLVVAEIEIGLGAVVGDEDFAVLEWRHRSRIDVEIGIELHDRHAHSALDEKSAERGGRNPLPKRRYHAAGDEDVARLLAGTTLHWSLLLP
jgi:hypothetical protein